MGRSAVTQRKPAGKSPEPEKKPAEKKGAEKQPAARHVARTPAFVQRRMAVSQPGDALEQEAEQVARAVAKPDEKKGAAPSAAAGAAKRPDEKKAGAAKLARKEIDGDAKLEKQKEAQAGKAKQQAKDEAAQKTKGDDAAKPDEAGKPAQRAPKITRMAGGAIAPLLRRARASEPAAAEEHAAADLERRIDGKRGGGAPLPPAARADMEQKLGHDFSQVRVHDDAAAQSLAHELDAHAFTVGNDLFFGAGQMAPGTAAGDHLMAHELTHVVQQGGAQGGGAVAPSRGGGAVAPSTLGGGGPLIARKGSAEASGKQESASGESKLSADGNEYVSGKDRLDKTAKQLEVGALSLPKLKAGFIPATDFVLPAKRERTDGHRAAWDAEAVPKAQAAVEKKVGTTKPLKIRDQDVWYLRIGGDDRYLAGSKETIAKRVARPYWKAEGSLQFFDVDHKKEWQLGGGDEVDNLWLLHSSANRSFGSRINNALESAVGGVLADARASGMKLPGTSLETIRGNSWTVTLKTIKPGESIDGQGVRYEMKDVEAGKPLQGTKVLTGGEAKKKGLAGDPDQLTLFTNASGGRPLRIPMKDGAPQLGKPIQLGKNFELQSVAWKEGQSGSIAGTAFRDDKYVKGKPITADIVPHEAVEFGGMVSQSSLQKQASALLEAKGMSPIKLHSIELADNGLVADGVIEPSIPALKGASVDLSIRGDSVAISKTFAADEVKLPGPIQMTGGALTVFAGTKGIGVEGTLGFEVDKLCKGTLKAGAGMGAGGAGFVLEGKCVVREDLFDPGTLEFRYEASEGASKLSGSAELGIKTDKLKFVKSATGKVTLCDEQWGLEGTVVLDVPGADEAQLSIGRAPDGTVTIAGKIAVAGKGPLKSGSLDATLEKGDGEWKAKGSGSAALAVPGLDSAKVTIDYENGAFTAVGDVTYAKGMLKGGVHAGVTNRAVGEDGVPAGEATPDLTVFGAGSVTLQIAPWLQGTVGIKLLPNGEVEIAGEVALPSAIDLFPEKRFDKNLFSIGIDIPIVGFTIMGQRIGIFATIGGGLDFSAGVGPGQLRDAKLSVKYNPAHEEETQVDGSASFVIPADAGLTMKVHGGIGAGIPVVSATAGLELSGKVGLEAEAKAAAEVHWNPRDGLKLHAEASLSAQPTFKFDVSGFVRVDIDLLLWEETLYEKRWSLAAFEYGSGMKFGVTFPVDWDQQKGLDLSLDNIKVEAPEIDAGSLLEGLIDKI